MSKLSNETGVSVKKDINEEAEAKENIEEREFTEEETRNQMRLHEEDMIQGLIAAAGFSEEETKTIEVVRGGKTYFSFRIRPLSSEEYDNCRKKHTKYVRNKRLGMKMPDETKRVEYQSDIIYQATVPEDREKLWDNRQVWDALSIKKNRIMNGLVVIECALKAGEKDQILQEIDKLSGYDDELEETVKN
ncbi:hypothetical protein AALB52_20720 [Lachnospiraceae bacterium 38-14]